MPTIFLSFFLSRTKASKISRDSKRSEQTSIEPIHSRRIAKSSIRTRKRQCSRDIPSAPPVYRFFRKEKGGLVAGKVDFSPSPTTFRRRTHHDPPRTGIKFNCLAVAFGRVRNAREPRSCSIPPGWFFPSTGVTSRHVTSPFAGQRRGGGGG